MRLLKTVFGSLSIATIVFLIALFFAIIPCQKAPLVPNPEYTWSFCTLNPDTDFTKTSTKFFGGTESLRQAYIFLYGLIFIISLVIFSLVKKPRRIK